MLRPLKSSRQEESSACGQRPVPVYLFAAVLQQEFCSVTQDRPKSSADYFSSNSVLMTANGSLYYHFHSVSLYCSTVSYIRWITSLGGFTWSSLVATM